MYGCDMILCLLYGLAFVKHEQMHTENECNEILTFAAVVCPFFHFCLCEVVVIFGVMRLKKIKQCLLSLTQCTNNESMMCT